jgi:hypothetical protein
MGERCRDASRLGSGHLELVESSGRFVVRKIAVGLIVGAWAMLSPFNAFAFGFQPWQPYFVGSCPMALRLAT